MLLQKIGWRLVARSIVFIWFFIGGVAHLALPEIFLRVMPPYIAFPLVCVYISGAFELLGAFGIWIKCLSSVAGYGLMLLTAIVTLVNIHMYQHAELFQSIPEWLLLVRLPIQAGLIWLIWWSTRPDSNKYLSKFLVKN